jgi:hypothetical protein
MLIYMHRLHLPLSQVYNEAEVMLMPPAGGAAAVGGPVDDDAGNKGDDKKTQAAAAAAAAAADTEGGGNSRSKEAPPKKPPPPVRLRNAARVAPSCGRRWFLTWLCFLLLSTLASTCMLLPSPHREGCTVAVLQQTGNMAASTHDTYSVVYAGVRSYGCTAAFHDPLHMSAGPAESSSSNKGSNQPHTSPGGMPLLGWQPAKESGTCYLRAGVAVFEHRTHQVGG